MQFKKLKKEEGFTTADIAVSVILLVMFVSVIASAFYNYYLTINAKNRNAIATNVIIDVIEFVKIKEYEEVANENTIKWIQELYANKTIPNQYKVTMQVQKYNEMVGKQGKQDIIKKLTVQVEYPVGQQTKKIDTSTLIIK